MADRENPSPGGAAWPPPAGPAPGEQPKKRRRGPVGCLIVAGLLLGPCVCLSYQHVKGNDLRRACGAIQVGEPLEAALARVRPLERVHVRIDEPGAGFVASTFAGLPAPGAYGFICTVKAAGGKVTRAEFEERD